jgi:hypothetical protein
MKKSLYKIGDKVTVFFLDSKHEAEIIEVRQHPQKHENIIYTVRTDRNLIIPYVGVDGSEKYSNIFTNNEKKLNLKNNQNGTNRIKRKSKSIDEENN